MCTNALSSSSLVPGSASAMPAGSASIVGNTLFERVRAVTEKVSPIGDLYETFLKGMRPVARPEQISYETRCLDHAMWAAYAIAERKRAMDAGTCTSPPCVVCGKMTWQPCPGCQSAYLCSPCDGGFLSCYVCLSIERMGLDNARVAAHNRATDPLCSDYRVPPNYQRLKAECHAEQTSKRKVEIIAGDLDTSKKCKSSARI